MKNKYVRKAFSQLSLSELCQSLRGNIGDFTYRPNKTQREEGNLTETHTPSGRIATEMCVCVCLKFYCILSSGKEQYKRILEFFSIFKIFYPKCKILVRNLCFLISSPKLRNRHEAVTFNSNSLGL